MKQRQLTKVSSVWTHGNYAHGHMPTPTSLRLAERILNGTAMDISQGAIRIPGIQDKDFKFYRP